MIALWKISKKGQRTMFDDKLIARCNRPCISIFQTELRFHLGAQLAIRKVPAKGAIALK
jgi:hypothetical protein